MNVLEQSTLLSPINVEDLRSKVRASSPVPNFVIDNFLAEEFANEIADAFPSYESALSKGMSFNALNEMGKVQLTDSSHFPEPILRLHKLLNSDEFLQKMSYVMDIPNLLADDKLVGGGMHQTGPRGRLDVHVDFNYLADRKLHRRLNILIYFNRNWKEGWGGNFELWDSKVKVCHKSISPVFNRCAVFATNEISYHGVTAVMCPDNETRKSYAAYYYTVEPPIGWTGKSHSTIFKARPNEPIKKYVLMPYQKAKNSVIGSLRKFKKHLIG